MSRLIKVTKGIDLISEYTAKAFSFLVPLMVILQVIEVIRRYIFGSPTMWNWELVTLMYGVHFMIGGAWILKEDSHVRTDVFYDKFSPKMQAITDIILFASIFIMFAGLLSFQSIRHAIWSFGIRQTSYTQWGPPIYPLKIIIALSYILLFFQGIVNIIKDVIFVFKGKRI